ncbi:NAD(P)H-binding protein [Acidipropionibacterium acidipropionici]|uniref:NAD(P)H-binding protein n=1 Tax=Acidipropionibacterium acidipropionici TaxID=1748 RepID=UPI0002DD1D7D|nr:NAD(P)H-binding protein [Acidipropionibacterium acidipropionici]
MKYLITGAGQIGSAIAQQLIDAGHDVAIIRRSEKPVPGTPSARVIAGDAGDTALLERELDGVDAVFHCIHAAYDADAWRKVLPGRELAVMDAAAARDVPVVFPESVYGATVPRTWWKTQPAGTHRSPAHRSARSAANCWRPGRRIRRGRCHWSPRTSSVRQRTRAVRWRRCRSSSRSHKAGGGSCWETRPSPTR